MSMKVKAGVVATLPYGSGDGYGFGGGATVTFQYLTYAGSSKKSGALTVVLGEGKAAYELAHVVAVAPEILRAVKEFTEKYEHAAGLSQECDIFKDLLRKATP